MPKSQIRRRLWFGHLLYIPHCDLYFRRRWPPIVLHTFSWGDQVSKQNQKSDISDHRCKRVLLILLLVSIKVGLLAVFGKTKGLKIKNWKSKEKQECFVWKNGEKIKQLFELEVKKRKRVWNIFHQILQVPLPNC